MIQRVRKQIEEWNMIQKGDCIAAAVSGGADSVCLLLLLKELEQSMGFSLYAVHVEHGIRGEESMQDASFVKELCEALNIPCETFFVDALAYAKEQKMGLEEAARILRYEKFRAYAMQKKAKIALAHHMEDNAETVLFQMLRGSSLTGLGGILPLRTDERGITYIRPLLTAHRYEIEAYLKSVGQTFCIDATNLENDYSRNYLRNIVMPYLQKINAQAVSHINKTACDILEVRDYIEIEAQKQMELLVKQKQNSWYLDITALTELHIALQKQIVYQFLAKASGSKKDIASVHVERLLSLANMQSGKQIHLPYGLIAKREYSNLCLYLKEDKKQITHDLSNIFISEEMLLECSKNEKSISFSIGEQGETFSIRVLKKTSEIEEIPKKTYTKWLDYDKIKQGFCIRIRQSGDYFISDAMGHRKKLKQYFIDEKISTSKRNTMWLLAQESEVFWIVGGRIGENVKVTENTKTIIEMNYNGGM